MFYEEFILKRHQENPIIKPADFSGAEAIWKNNSTDFSAPQIRLLSW